MRDDNASNCRLSGEISALRQRVGELEKWANSGMQHHDLADSLPDAVFEMDQNNTISFGNHSGLAIFGYTEKDIEKGLDGLSVVIPQDRSRAQENLNRVAKGERLGPNEYTALAKNGRTFPVVIHTSPIRQNGKVSGIRGIIVDITKLKQTEEALRLAKSELEKKVEDRTIQLKIANEKLERVFEGTIISLSSAVEQRDPYTAGHQQKVARLALAIGKKLGLSADTNKGVHVAALVHDIGKIYIPAEILCKPTMLSEVEFNIIKTHSSVGHEILSTIEFPWPIAQIVLQHHERLDGSGYPSGLTGDDILPEAKIIAIADVIEAMSSHRPYRPSLGLDRALAEISQNKGSRYDSQTADACLELFAKHEFDFTEQNNEKLFN